LFDWYFGTCIGIFAIYIGIFGICIGIFGYTTIPSGKPGWKRTNKLQSGFYDFLNIWYFWYATIYDMASGNPGWKRTNEWNLCFVF
jgi:hypothetical protein